MAEQRLFVGDGFEMGYSIAGEGEPLVLLHGFTGSGGDFGHLFAEPPPGFRFVIPDLRGHGRSTGGEEFTFRRCAADVHALLGELGIESYSAIGLSGGGQVLLHMATSQPERAEALVLVSTAPYFPQPARAIMRTLTVESRSEADWQEMRGRHAHGDEQVRLLWETGRGFADSFDDVCFTPPQLARIRASTLVAHGDRDPLYPVALALGMAEAIPSSFLWVVPSGGHLPIFAEGRDAFVSTVTSFLSGVWEAA